MLIIPLHLINTFSKRVRIQVAHVAILAAEVLRETGFLCVTLD